LYQLSYNYIFSYKLLNAQPSFEKNLSKEFFVCFGCVEEHFSFQSSPKKGGTGWCQKQENPKKQLNLF
jgi:hypothetical protein